MNRIQMMLEASDIIEFISTQISNEHIIEQSNLGRTTRRYKILEEEIEGFQEIASYARRIKENLKAMEVQ